MPVRMRSDLAGQDLLIPGVEQVVHYLTPEDIENATVLAQDEVTGEVTIRISRPDKTTAIVKVDSIDLEFS